MIQILGKAHSERGCSKVMNLWGREDMFISLLMSHLQPTGDTKIILPSSLSAIFFSWCNLPLMKTEL